MKQRKVVSMIGALVLIISAVVLITGCSQPNSNKGNTGNNSGNISNNGGNTGNNGGNTGNNGGNTGNNGGNTGNNGGNTGNNGGNTGNNGGSTGNNGGNTGNNGGNTGSTDILKKDIIEFETASVKCQKTNSFPYTDVTSGSQIQEKDKLLFEAILPTGKVVENWYINDAKQKYQTDSKMFYTVRASDIVGGKLKVSVLTKDAVQSTVEFETASVKCTNTNSYTKVTSGSQIQEKDKLLFEAILPTGKVVENWYINDAKQEYQTDSKMFYTVRASDIVGGKLKVSVITKDAVQGTVEFDVASVKCTNTNSYTKVTSGSQIQEKDELLFEAILPTGKVVENWYINDVKQKYNTDSVMGYKVKASDIASGTLKISVVFK